MPPAGVSRKRLSEVLPRRESSRLRGIAADGSQVHSERQGQVSALPAGACLRLRQPPALLALGQAVQAVQSST